MCWLIWLMGCSSPAFALGNQINKIAWWPGICSLLFAMFKTPLSVSYLYLWGASIHNFFCFTYWLTRKPFVATGYYFAYFSLPLPSLRNSQEKGGKKSPKLINHLTVSKICSHNSLFWFSSREKIRAWWDGAHSQVWMCLGGSGCVSDFLLLSCVNKWSNYSLLLLLLFFNLYTILF